MPGTRTKSAQKGPARTAGRFAARLNRYRFESVWTLEESCEEVFDTLQDLFSYPSWWPEVRKVDVLDHSTAAVLIRAALPYKLRFQLKQGVVDPRAGVLEASMTGDLEGWSRWSIDSGPGGCRLKFEEEVVVNRPLLRALSPVARPFLKANHLLMMRRGESGLRRYLAGNSRDRHGVELREDRLKEDDGDRDA